MRRALLRVCALLAVLIVVPPLFYAVAGGPVPELPAADRRIPVSGSVSVAAIDRGAGPPVVLVHGLPGCASDWRLTIDALVEHGHRVIAYSRVGYGRSDGRTNGDYTPDGNAADLLGMLGAEDLRDATVVGWSYGGATLIRAAIRDDARIGRLVLVGSVGPWPDAPEAPAIFRLIFSGPVLGWIARVPPVGRAVQAALSRESFGDEPIPDWWGEQLAANFVSPHTRRTLSQESGRHGRYEGLDPGSIDRPILVIHGDQDRSVPIEVGRRLADLARDGELVVVEGGSHMLPITRPQLLADRIARFARGTRGVARR